MSGPLPDVAGFLDGQDRLREQLGSPITFRVPTTAEWPEGTKLNPDTGEPYDATIKQTNLAYAEIVRNCLVILKQASPLRPQPDTQFSPLGEASGMDIIIDIADEDYTGLTLAYEAVFAGRVYRIVETKPFMLADTPYRFLLYGEET